ncbi:MAG: TonB-dependent receptor [Marinifilaceae bacterium]
MRFIFLLCALVASGALSAQTIKGRVIEKTDKGAQGIPAANVYWLGTSKGVVTDVDGKFEIDWNESGKLIASFIGYNADTLNVTPKDKRIEFTLVEGEMLDEVQVYTRGKSTIMGTGPMMEQILTGEELCKAACCNLGESFTTNASVDVSYADAVTGAKQIQLLGLTGRYVQMMTENQPNFRGVSSLYGLGYVPGPWMSAISVSKGIGSVLNGYEAIAGQVSVDYKKPLEEKFFLNAYASSEGMYEFNTNVGAKLGKRWSTAILAHGDWFNKEHDTNKDGFLDMPKKTQYNIMNRWAYADDKWFIQFGGKYIEETRNGGQGGHNAHFENPFAINIDTRRGEGFLKIGALMPRYENTSMALIMNYVDHDQKSLFGERRYDARQQTVYANYVFQSIFGNNVNQKYSFGFTGNYDRYDEYLLDRLFTNPTEGGVNAGKDASWDREEKVAGAYFQYTGSFRDKFTIMAGARYDYHNQYKGFFTPRMHLMYTPSDMTTLKISGGKGYRTANILAENSYLFASAKNIYVNNNLLVDNPASIYDLKMEEAWNYGVSFTQKFLLLGRMATFNADFFRTEFTNQVIVDNESAAGRINFYNLDGDSYSNCYQVELRYELIPRLDVLGAFRYNDSKYTLASGELVRTPLQSKYKGLLNLSYYTNMKKWQFDFTTQFNGGGRMPSNDIVTEDIYKTSDSFKPYQIMNAQVTKYFRKWSIYAGCENIGDYTQKEAIVAADAPWNTNFDATKIWGPIHGRKFYVGLRFTIDRD